MKAITIILVGLVLSVTLVSAFSVDFFYSPSCPHCKKVMPLVNILLNIYKDYDWNYYDVTKGSYDVRGVPTIKLKTDDYREMTLIGEYEVARWLDCELQQMTTKECPTSTELNETTQSYFIR